MSRRNSLTGGTSRPGRIDNTERHPAVRAVHHTPDPRDHQRGDVPDHPSFHAFSSTSRPMSITPMSAQSEQAQVSRRRHDGRTSLRSAMPGDAQRRQVPGLVRSTGHSSGSHTPRARRSSLTSTSPNGVRLRPSRHRNTRHGRPAASTSAETSASPASDSRPAASLKLTRASPAIARSPAHQVRGVSNNATARNRPNLATPRGHRQNRVRNRHAHRQVGSRTDIFSGPLHLPPFPHRQLIRTLIRIPLKGEYAGGRECAGRAGNKSSSGLPGCIRAQLVKQLSMARRTCRPVR